MPEIRNSMNSKSAALAREGETWLAMVWRRLKKHKLAMFGLVIITFFSLMALLAPWVAPHCPHEQRLELAPRGRPMAPNLAHPFGTDDLGRDYLSRVIYGGRVSLAVGLVAMSISITIGSALGSMAGYYGGWMDDIICRFTDVMLCIPRFFLILAVSAYLSPNIFNVMIVIGAFGWMGVARLVRGEFLKLRDQEFVEAARAVGSSDRRIMIRHLFPNALAPVIVAATMGMAQAILLEAALSYLGLGVQPPAASWGNMLQQAQGYLTEAPWMSIIPGAFISLTVLSFNFIGDGLRDAMDPKLKQ